MYITETSQKVYDLFNEFDELDDKEKLEVNIIIFEEWSSNLINSKNTADVLKYDDSEIEIFNPSVIGLNNNIGHYCSSMFIMLLNGLLTENRLSIKEIENLDFLSIKLSENSSKWISCYEKLSFLEKLDVLTEIFIRYDNNTLFETLKGLLKIDTSIDGYTMARLIKNYKHNIYKNNKNEFPYEIINK